MARIQDLSNELVIGILEHVSPDDIESVSLASKRIYQLAIPRLEEHRMLRKQYTNIHTRVLNKSVNWYVSEWLLVHLLCKITSDFRVGYYVKKIDLSLLSYAAKDGWKPDEIFERPFTTGNTWVQQGSKTKMDIIEEAIRATEIIPIEEVDDWLYQIRSGSEDPLVALLFLNAPRLQMLEFVAQYNHYEPSYLLKSIQRVARQGLTVKPYPSQLKNVHIHCAVGRESLALVKAFLSLPSLTSITTDSLFV